MFRGSGQDSNRDSKGELHDSIVADATTHYPTGKPRMLMTSDQIIPEQTEETNPNLTAEAKGY